MAKHPKYSVHPSISRSEAILKNLPNTTGRSLNEWSQLLDTACPADHKIRLDWLKTGHRLGGETSWLIAARSLGQALDISDPDTYLQDAAGYVDAMFDGKKSHLRPLYDALIDLALSLGNDVKICPCQTIVPLYRQRVFAQIKPTTLTRIDFGLCLRNCERPLPGRLTDTGGLQKGDRITHRFALQSPKDLDAEVREWAGVAYELDK